MIADLAKIAGSAAAASYRDYLLLKSNHVAKRDEMIAMLTVHAMLSYLARAAERAADDAAAKAG